MVSWDEKSTVFFLKEYEKHPCLWNPYHKNYCNCLAKNEALKKIIQVLNIPELTIADCLQQIKIIREKYRKEQSRTITRLYSQKPYKSPFAWYDLVAKMLMKVISDEGKSISSKALQTSVSESSITNDIYLNTLTRATSKMKKWKRKKNRYHASHTLFPRANILSRSIQQRRRPETSITSNRKAVQAKNDNVQMDYSSCLCLDKEQTGNNIKLQKNHNLISFNTEENKHIWFTETEPVNVRPTKEDKKNYEVQLQCPSCGWEDPKLKPNVIPGLQYAEYSSRIYDRNGIHKSMYSNQEIVNSQIVLCPNIRQQSVSTSKTEVCTKETQISLRQCLLDQKVNQTENETRKCCKNETQNTICTYDKNQIVLCSVFSQTMKESETNTERNQLEEKCYAITEILLHCVAKLLQLCDTNQVQAAVLFLLKKIKLYLRNSCLPGTKAEANDAISILTQTFWEAVKCAFDMARRHSFVKNQKCKCSSKKLLVDIAEIINKIEKCIERILDNDFLYDFCSKCNIRTSSLPEPEISSSSKETQTMDCKKTQINECEKNDEKLYCTSTSQTNDIDSESDTAFLETIIEEKLSFEDKGINTRSETCNVGTSGSVPKISSRTVGSQSVMKSLNNASVLTEYTVNAQKPISTGTQTRNPTLMHVVQCNERKIVKSDKEIDAKVANNERKTTNKSTQTFCRNLSQNIYKNGPLENYSTEITYFNDISESIYRKRQRSKNLRKELTSCPTFECQKGYKDCILFNQDWSRVNTYDMFSHTTNATKIPLCTRRRPVCNRNEKTIF